MEVLINFKIKKEKEKQDMKREERSEIELVKALDILISYQAYCLSTGYSHKSFAEAFYDKDIMKMINTYYDLLHDIDDEQDNEHYRECARKIVKLIPYVTTNDLLADAFIQLNKYLRKCYGKLCVLSWYDMQTIIKLFGGREKCVGKMFNGVIKYNLTTYSFKHMIRRVISGSIHSMDTFISWMSQDCLLHSASLWLLSERCMIDSRGVKAGFLFNCDDADRYIRSDTVFTKVISKSVPRKGSTTAKRYNYDCIDMVASLLFGLPTLAVEVNDIPADATLRGISKFMNSMNYDNSYTGEHITIMQSGNKRAMQVGNIYILSAHIDVDNLYVVSVVDGDRAFVFNVNDSELLDCDTHTSMSPELIQSVGKTFDFAIEGDKDNTIKVFISKLYGKQLEEVTDDIAEKIIQEAV